MWNYVKRRTKYFTTQISRKYFLKFFFFICVPYTTNYINILNENFKKLNFQLLKFFQDLQTMICCLKTGKKRRLLNSSSFMESKIFLAFTKKNLNFYFCIFFCNSIIKIRINIGTIETHVGSFLWTKMKITPNSHFLRSYQSIPYFGWKTLYLPIIHINDELK